MSIWQKLLIIIEILMLVNLLITFVILAGNVMTQQAWEEGYRNTKPMSKKSEEMFARLFFGSVVYFLIEGVVRLGFWLGA